MGSLSRDTSAGGVLRSDTAKTATGTSVDFTGIPSWVKRITVMFSGVSTNGTSPLLVQIGSGSVETTSYASVGTGTDTTSGVNTATTGYVIRVNSASNSVSAQMVLTTLGSNVWVASHSGSQGAASLSGGGTKTTSGTLDRIRITTVNGTDTFDAGTINILYE